MGALHAGHLDLISRAREAHTYVACSIFVNPLQFNDPRDLERYPRQLDKDRDLLLKAGCDMLFAPSKEAIFDAFTPSHHDLGALADFWEGPSRPGHFQGVVNVVERLFHYVRPEEAFFGEKDRQQLTILRYVAKTLHWPELVTGCPTVRASDGLALSSRNARLDERERRKATVLFRALEHVAQQAFTAPVAEVEAAGKAIIAEEEGVALDYFGVADHDSLAPLESWGTRERAVALVAAHVGPVRLIDNITLVRATR